MPPPPPLAAHTTPPCTNDKFEYRHPSVSFFFPNRLFFSSALACLPLACLIDNNRPPAILIIIHIIVSPSFTTIHCWTNPMREERPSFTSSWTAFGLWCGVVSDTHKQGGTSTTRQGDHSLDRSFFSPPLHRDRRRRRHPKDERGDIRLD